MQKENLIFSTLSSDLPQTFRLIHNLNPEVFTSHMNDKTIYNNGLPLWINAFLYSERKQTPLLNEDIFIQKNHEALVKTFIEFGGDVNEEVETGEMGRVPMWLAALNERFNMVGPSSFTRVFEHLLKEVHPESFLKWRDVNTGIMSKAFKEYGCAEIEMLLNHGFHHHPDENEAISQKILEVSRTWNVPLTTQLSDLFKKSKEILKSNPRFSAIDLSQNNEELFDLIAAPLKSQRSVWSKSMSGPLIRQYNQSKNDLNEKQKEKLLQLSLHLTDLSVAKHIAEDFGISLASNKGLREVIPLLDEPDNEVFLKKIIEKSWFNEEKISGRFGEISGLLAFSRSIPENIFFSNLLVENKRLLSGSFTPFFKRKKKRNQHPATEEFLSKLFDKKVESGDFKFETFLQKDENGKFILQQEREDNRKRERRLSYAKFPDSVGAEEGNLNWLAKEYLLCSQSFELGKEDLDFSDISKEVLREKCKNNPELIKTACQALIFDIDEKGDESVQPLFHQSFFKLTREQNWLQHLDVLNEFNILSLGQKEKIFSHLMGIELNNYNLSSSFRDRDYQFDQFFKLFEELQQNPETNWKEMNVCYAQRNFLKLDKEDCSQNNVMQKFKNVCNQALILVEKNQLVSAVGVKDEGIKKAHPFKI